MVVYSTRIQHRQLDHRSNVLFSALFDVLFINLSYNCVRG